MRLTPAEFRRLPLYAHSFLADAPVHDVWVIHLNEAPPGLTARDLLPLFDTAGMARLTPPVRALFELRWALGRLFRWDSPGELNGPPPPASYIHRLPAADHARSLEPPGAPLGLFRTVYVFEHEALAEIINRTVHAFSLLALQPTAGGQALYWSIYVKPVSWFTPVYMALIDPFRRWLIYPALLRYFKAGWARALESRARPD